MKLSSLLLSVGLLAGSIAPAVAANGADTQATVAVTFSEPEKFSDLRASYGARREADTGYLRELQKHFERAARRLPAGQRLEVTVTDVDMAGDFEPWRGPSLMDVRIVKDIYPPRMDLSFRLLDANGNVVVEGERELRNLAFNMTASPVTRDDPLRHEKALIDDFVRDLVRETKRASRT